MDNDYSEQLKYKNTIMVEKPLTIEEWKDIVFYRNVKISKTMNSTLKKLLYNNEIKINNRTKSSLLKNKLITNDQKLTHFGYINAIKTVPLKNQCELLSIPLEELQVENKKTIKIEELAIKYFNENNFNALFCEGNIFRDILNTLKLLILLPIANKCIKNKENRYFELYCSNYGNKFKENIKRQILDKIPLINTKIFDEHYKIYSEIKDKNCKYIDYQYSRYTHADLLNIFSIIPNNIFVKIMESVFYNNLTFTGWPDLIVYNNEEYSLIEVKKNDNLILSQIETFSILKSIDIPIKVYKFKIIDKK